MTSITANYGNYQATNRAGNNSARNTEWYLGFRVVLYVK